LAIATAITARDAAAAKELVRHHLNRTSTLLLQRLDAAE
jgi:DNA-binding GntR family transcriptional regulator